MPKHHTTHLIAKAVATSGIACALAFGSTAQAQSTPKRRVAAAPEIVTTAELARRLDELAKQNTALQAKLDKLEAAQAQQATQVQQQAVQVRQQAVTQQAQATRVEEQAQAVETVQETVATSTSAAASGWAASTTVGAYGEIGYSHPTKSAKDTNADVQRAVIGIQHRFDDRTKMVGEFEWEHAITSADDRGEAEVEQLWLEREFRNGLRARAGLFLMPVGLVNQNHEPTAYYGVYRPDVDTKIVPSTWREIGLGLSGDTSQGLTWDVAMTTMPNLGGWDASSTEGRERGPLQSIHGEGQFAAARDLGAVGALNWRGVPGLLVGGSVVYGGIGQHQPGFAGNGSRLLMLDLHGRYQVAGWDFAGEYIRGTISNTEALNSSYAASSIAGPTLVPHLFYGGYVQAAYNVWHRDDYTLSPFVRFEVLNTAAGYGGLSVAQGGVKRPDEKIVTVGASLKIGEGIVLKADYRSYRNQRLPDAAEHFTLGNSFNLGAGFSF
ncbi:MAG: hypothetical protein JWQ11_3699 [Rhizobacter sp.]|nr:hypothetical protein [Rhizobacter sp.]